MRNTWAICRREFSAYFLTPVGYVVAGMVASITGMAFTFSFLLYAKMTQSPATYKFATVPDLEEWLVSPFIVFCGMLLMFLSPLLTMRLFAEERHRGTIELLFTYPLRDREVIFGKFFAAMGMVLVLMLIVGLDLCLVAWFAEIEVAVLLFGLLTLVLMGAAFISLGLFVSALTRNQITSGTVAFGIFLCLFIAGSIGEYLPAANPAPGAWPEGARVLVAFGYQVLRGFILEMSLDTHAKDMAQGIFQPKDVVFYLLFTAFFLFLTFRALESRNWRS